jgi:hypothetical protein
MDLFSLDFTPNELNFIRQSLDLVTIKGNDAKFLADLQIKIENELIEIQRLIQQDQHQKEDVLKQIIANDTPNSPSSKK